MDNVVQVIEAVRSQEPDRLENLELWGELMNNYSFTLGRLTENPQIMAIVDQSKERDFKHAAEVLMWVIRVASDEGHDDSRLKAMLSPYMKPVTGVPKPYNNLIRLQTLMQTLQELKPAQPAQLLGEIYMLDISGDVNCTNDEFIHPPQDAT